MGIGVISKAMNKRPHILITNDDGILAPGIRHLWKALSELADVTIVAPATEQSAMSLAVTIRTPLRMEKVDWPEEANAWSVSGTPVDCVKMALSLLMKSPPDLIVSGINKGSNHGRNVLYSGTVAAVIEGTMQNIPGIAFSCTQFVKPKYHLTERFIPTIVSYVLEKGLPSDTFLNVNFPDHQEIKGVKLTSQGKAYWAESPQKRGHPSEESYEYYWLGSKEAYFEEEENSDVAWLKKGYATAVPLRVRELTSHSWLQERKQQFDNLFP